MRLTARSAVTRSQIAALFFAMLGTLIPATQFSGLTDPVSSLEGAGRWIGEIYPATHMFAISRGVFSKALGLHDLASAYVLFEIYKETAERLEARKMLYRMFDVLRLWPVRA